MVLSNSADRKSDRFSPSRRNSRKRPRASAWSNCWSSSPSSASCSLFFCRQCRRRRIGQPIAVRKPSQADRPGLADAPRRPSAPPERRLGLELDRRSRPWLRTPAARRLGFQYSCLMSKKSIVHDIGSGMSDSDKSTANIQRLATPIPLFYCPSRRAATLYPNTEHPAANNCGDLAMVGPRQIMRPMSVTPTTTRTPSELTRPIARQLFVLPVQHGSAKSGRGR